METALLQMCASNVLRFYNIFLYLYVFISHLFVFTFRCKPGWKGSNCSQCIPHESCVHATCNRAYQCICKKGWGGRYCHLGNGVFLFVHIDIVLWSVLATTEFIFDVNSAYFYFYFISTTFCLCVIRMSLRSSNVMFVPQ